ncbi:hypothetical protein A8319_002480 [Escherichia coli]|nr:hypothetical protein [Escherichia coli]
MSLTTEIASLTQAANRLTEEVSNKQSAIDKKVNDKIKELEHWKNNLKAVDVAGEPRYTSIIDLTGLSSERYYPVWWRFPDNRNGENKITICRSFNEDLNRYPFGQGVTHLAALFLEMEGVDCSWGGDAQHLSIIRLSQNYRKTVKQINLSMKCIARPIDGSRPLYQNVHSGDDYNCQIQSGIYLRGGLTYHVINNFTHQVNYSRLDTEVEIGRAIQANNVSEIKWTVKSYAINDPFLGSEYDEYRAAYTQYNDTRYTRKA